MFSVFLSRQWVGFNNNNQASQILPQKVIIHWLFSNIFTDNHQFYQINDYISVLIARYIIILDTQNLLLVLYSSLLPDSFSPHVGAYIFSIIVYHGSTSDNCVQTLLTPSNSGQYRTAQPWAAYGYSALLIHNFLRYFMDMHNILIWWWLVV